MKPYFCTLFAAATMGLMLTGCQQPVAATAAPETPAAAPSVTPAPTTTVIEEVHRGHDDADARKMDRDHPRPDDNARRDHPDGH